MFSFVHFLTSSLLSFLLLQFYIHASIIHQAQAHPRTPPTTPQKKLSPLLIQRHHEG
jgi:hypothetical protein